MADGARRPRAVGLALLERLRQGRPSKVTRLGRTSSSWLRQLFRVGEDWYFLFALGVIMAMISFVMDFTVTTLLNGNYRWGESRLC
uniref:Uncharacterized protein n=1 Tax=Crocodylus porosus TaxID=8502 RepID=A0A7M4FGC0_CROPO